MTPFYWTELGIRQCRKSARVRPAKAQFRPFVREAVRRDQGQPFVPPTVIEQYPFVPALQS
jgi:hypothetical protein